MRSRGGLLDGEDRSNPAHGIGPLATRGGLVAVATHHDAVSRGSGRAKQQQLQRRFGGGGCGGVRPSTVRMTLFVAGLMLATARVFSVNAAAGGWRVVVTMAGDVGGGGGGGELASGRVGAPDEARIGLRGGFFRGSWRGAEAYGRAGLGFRV